MRRSAMLLLLLWARSAEAQEHDFFTPAALRFGAVPSSKPVPVVTPAQAVLVTTPGNLPLKFAASTDVPWLTVTPDTGPAPGRLIVAVQPHLLNRDGAQIGRVLLRFVGSGTKTEAQLPVTVSVLRQESRPPFGFFESSAGETSVVTEASVALSGWALDDVGVEEVAICQDRPPGQLGGASVCGDGTKRFVGSAQFASGIRRDVEETMRDAPRSVRAAWSFPLDRTSLQTESGRPVRVYAIARDGEGHATVLGSRVLSFGAWSWPRVSRVPWLVLAFLTILALVHAWLYRSIRRIQDGVASVQPAARPASRTWLAAAYLTVLSAIFIVINTRHESAGFYYDELYTASHSVVGHSFWHAVTTVSVFNNHVAFSLLAQASTRWFGTAEWAIRLPSLLLATATLWVFWSFAKMTAGRFVAWVGTALLAVLPFFAVWSHAARGYAGLTAMSFVSAIGFFWLMRGGSRFAFWCHLAGSVLAVYFHLYGLWVLGIQFALFAILAGGGRLGRAWLQESPTAAGLRRLWWSFSIATVLLTVLHLPTADRLAAMTVIRGRNPFQPRFPVELYGDWFAAASLTAGLVLVLLSLIGLWCQRRLVLLYVLALLILPVATMWLILRPFDLYSRLFAFWTPFVAFLIASGLRNLIDVARAAGPRRIAGGAALLAAVPIVLIATSAWIQQDLRPVSHAYRDLLRPAMGEAGRRSYAVGQDSEMFDYYLSKPFRVLQSRDELRGALLDEGPITVAYHNMSWNSPEHVQMAALLRAHCAAMDNGSVVVFRCD